MEKNEVRNGVGPLRVVATDEEVYEAERWAQEQARGLSERIEGWKRQRGAYPRED